MTVPARRERRIAPQHEIMLEEHAIDPKTMLKQGSYTAYEAGDLPDRIACPTPAFCFRLQRLDGREVWQARPDRPRQGRPRPDGRRRPVKYVAQWGERGVIVDTSGHGAWRDADTILLCEGTKQSIVAARYAPDNVAVVGILGCSNWTVDGVPASDLTDLVRSSTASRIVVAFDADIRTNPNVWRAASRLRSTLTDLPATVRPDGPGLEVLFSTVQNRKGTAKADIDGVLGGLSDEERAREIARIIDEATPLDPWGGTLDLPVSVRPDLGLTLMRDGDTEDPDTPPASLPKNTVMNAALTIETAWQWLPDPNHPERGVPDTTLDLRMDAWQPDGDPVTEHIRGVKWSDLSDLGSLTLKAGPAGMAVSPPYKPSEKGMILAAMRRLATPDRTRIIRLSPRTGWQADPATGRMVWVAPQGAYGPDGFDPNLRGRTNQVVNNIRFTEDAPLYDTVLAATELTSLMRELVADPVRADACLGAFTLGMLPIPPKCAIGLFGKYSQGKSTLMQTYSSLLSDAWTPRAATSEFNFYATENAIGNSMDGVNGMPVFYDDMRMPDTPSERKRQNDIFDAIVRRSHGSQAKMRSTIKDGRVQVADRDNSQPLAFIVGERVPTDAAASALSRIFQVPMNTGRSFKGGEQLERILFDPSSPAAPLLARFAADHVKVRPSDGNKAFDEDAYNVLEGVYHLTDSPAWRGIIPLFVSYLARLWEETGDLPEWLETRRSSWQAAVIAQQTWVKARHDGVSLSTREAILVAGLMTGLQTWLEWLTPLATRILGQSLTERLRHLASAEGLMEVLESLTKTHLEAAANLDGDVNGEKSVLDRLHAAVSSGREARIRGIGEAREHDWRGVVGTVTTVDGVEVVALDPNAIRQTIRDFSSTSAADIADALSRLAVRDRRGSVRRPIRIGGTPTRCVCIPMTAWGGVDAGRPDGPVEEESPTPDTNTPKPASPVPVGNLPTPRILPSVTPAPSIPFADTSGTASSDTASGKPSGKGDDDASGR